MKYTIDKETFDKLGDDLKTEYTEQNGEYVLKLEGHENVLIPRKKWEISEQHKHAAEDKVAKAEAREADLLKKIENADGKKEIEAIRKQHEDEVKKIREEFETQQKELKTREHKALIETEATKFATEKFTTPTLVSKVFAERLTVEEIDGQPVIRVKEPDGKPSIKSLGDLQKEFLDNEEFSTIIKGSKGSGGGAQPSPRGGGAQGSNTMKRSEFDALSAQERSKFLVAEKGVLVDD